MRYFNHFNHEPDGIRWGVCAGLSVVKRKITLNENSRKIRQKMCVCAIYIYSAILSSVVKHIPSAGFFVAGSRKIYPGVRYRYIEFVPNLAGSV